MKRTPFQPRQWIAIGLGFVSVIVLVILIHRSDLTPTLFTPAEPQIIITTGAVKNGDVLARLLQGYKVPPSSISKIERALQPALKTRFIQPGHLFDVVTSTAGEFKQFVYRPDPIQTYTVTRSSVGETFSLSTEALKTVWIEKRVTGEVTESMYRDLLKMGFSDGFVANLVGDLADNIFAWRIDFFTEQRPGDRFDVLMEQEYLVGSDRPLWNGRGRILAATYVGKATKIKQNVAIRYQSPDAKRADYYDDEGKAVRRQFLRAPFTHSGFRVSSGFNPKRFHPILRTYRPHHGTDYAASRGTPVAVIGKGRVVRAEWYKGYGNCIDVQHSSSYVSRYGHLSKILVRRGQSVEQGQRIGLVGSTGLSTGPHLHFEMLVNGSQRNFLTMSFPAASAVATKDMPDFARVKDEALARLQAQPSFQPTKNPQTAMNQ